MIWGIPAGGLRWSGIAAADGGSTIPIPPPERPTPQSITPTPTLSIATANGPVNLDLGNLHLSPSTRAETTEGEIIPFTGSVILIENDSSGDRRVVLPFALTPGQEMLPFHDPESDITWLPSPTKAEGHALTIPLAGGRIPGTLTIRLDTLQGDGHKATATVLGATLDAGPVEMATLGETGAIRLSAELHRLPSEVALVVQGAARDAGLISALNGAVGVLNMGVAAVAYAARIETNLSNEIASASIEMAVEEEWAAAWTRDSIRIVRLSADGQGNILETTFVGKNVPGQARFEAQSPEGFSTFALIATGELTSGKSSSGSSWILWLGIGLGVVALLALGAGAYLLITLQRRGTST